MGAGQRGQASVEWVATTLLVALVLTGLLAVAGPRLPGGELARLVGARVLCAADLGSACERTRSSLVTAYGPELAAIVAAGAPRISYERGSLALPVDFRSCRSEACSNALGEGAVFESAAGVPATAFVRVIDCRGSAGSRLIAAASTQAPGSYPERSFAGGATRGDLGAALDAAARGPSAPVCTGEAAGNLYVQYWLFYPSSDTPLPVDPLLARLGGREAELGFHRDDWESWQLRIGPEGRFARASSHHGFNWRRDLGGVLSDPGIVPRPGWGPDTGRAFVSRGSHAGHVATREVALLRGAARVADGRARRLLNRAARRDPGDEGSTRFTPAGSLRLIPLEPIAAGDAAGTAFDVLPPWRKALWFDPELDSNEW